MKKIITLCILPFVFLFVSCGDRSNPDLLAKKRIFQHVDANGLGILEDLEVVSVEKVNDTTYKAIHTFTHSLMEKEVQITRNYFFTTNTDSIKNKEDLKVEMRSKSKWVKVNFSTP